MSVRQSKYLIVLAIVMLWMMVAPLPLKAQAVPESRSEIALSFAPVVSKVAPSVVNVYARQVVRTREVMPFFNDPFFRRFFGEGGFQGMPRERVQRSLGSGVIVSENGLIVTNNHVIGKGSEILVVLSDKREFEATVLAKDERTDLAILKIDTGDEKLPHIVLGDSDALEVGDLVLAIGNPFGVGQTVTSGIVSALARTARGISDYQFFIQTDAAINPGNSGGALVDMNGRLAGINTAIFSRTGGSHGIGFAIPVNMVRAVVDAIDADGRIRRPWVGASLQDITGEIAESLGLVRPRGGLVRDLHPLSPLRGAGIDIGDVILAVDGREVDDPRAFSYRVATSRLGERLEVKFWRNGEERRATLILEPAPEVPPSNETVLSGRSPLGGLRVANLSPALAEELGFEGTETGVVVLGIEDGPARLVRFQEGDVLLALNDMRIETVEDAQRASRFESRRYQLALRRDGQVLRTTIGW